MDNKKNLKLLRLLLICAGFGFFIAVFGVFMPWPSVVEQLVGLGAEKLPADPMLNYWLRMQSAINTLIGIFFFLLAHNPQKYKNILSLSGIFLFAEGGVLLTWGILLHLSPLPYMVDSAFCLVIGTGIFLVSRVYLKHVDQCRDNHRAGKPFAS